MFIELLTIILLTLPVPFIWFSHSYQLFGHDIGYHFNTIQYCSSLLYAWNPSINFGVDWGIQAPKALLLLQIPDCVLSQFVSNSWIIQMITSWIWMITPGLGMLLFLYRIFPERKYRFFRIFSSLFTVFNFFNLQGWQIVEKTKFSVFAAMPLLLLFLYNLLIERKNIGQNAVSIALLFLILNGGGLVPLFGGLLIAVTVFVIYWMVRSLKEDQFGKEIWIAVITVILAIFVNAYTIVPTIGNFISSFGNVVTYGGGETNFLAWERDISKNASLVNLFRLEGIPDWYSNPTHPYANQFIFKRTLILLSFLPIIIIIMGALKFGLREEKNRSRKFLLSYLWLLLVIGLIVAGGTHPPFGFIYQYAMKHIPGFIIFRSSFYKFAPAVWLPIIVLSGYYLNLLLFGLRLHKTIQKIAAGMCVLMLLGYHYPYFSTKAFNFNGTFSTRLRLPLYVSEMQQKIDGYVPDDGRILIYPPLDMGYIGSPLDTYIWGYYSLDTLPRMLTKRIIVANDLYGSQPLIEAMQQSLHDSDSKNFLQVATESGITHVLWRGDVRRSQAMDRDIPLAEMDQRLSTMSALKKEVQSGPWILYEVIGTIRPMIYALDNLDQSSRFVQSFKQVNPTMYTITTDPTVDATTQLVFNQQFSDNWQARAYTSVGQSVVLSNHTMINGFANAWEIDASNIERITLEYLPQRYFYFGLGITGITFVGIAIYFVTTNKRRIIRKRNI